MLHFYHFIHFVVLLIVSHAHCLE